MLTCQGAHLAADMVGAVLSRIHCAESLLSPPDLVCTLCVCVHQQAARVRSQQINSTGTKIFEVLPISGVIAPYSRATLTAHFKPVTAGRVKGFKATAPPSDEAFTYACQLSFDG